MIPGVRRESSEPILYRRIPGGVLVGPEQAPGSPFHSGGMLCGESHRERVITPGEETRYLASAPSLLSEIATVLVDTGLRPEECYRLLWDSINWVNSRNESSAARAPNDSKSPTRSRDALGHLRKAIGGLRLARANPERTY